MAPTQLNMEITVNTNINGHEGKKYLRRIRKPAGASCMVRSKEGVPDWEAKEAIGKIEVDSIQADVYAVLEAFGVTDQAVGQAVKKLLCAGQRGKGTRLDDLIGAQAAISRAIDSQLAADREVEDVRKTQIRAMVTEELKKAGGEEADRGSELTQNQRTVEDSNGVNEQANQWLNMTSPGIVPPQAGPGRAPVFRNVFRKSDKAGSDRELDQYDCVLDYEYITTRSFFGQAYGIHNPHRGYYYVHPRRPDWVVYVRVADDQQVAYSVHDKEKVGIKTLRVRHESKGSEVGEGVLQGPLPVVDGR